MDYKEETKKSYNKDPEYYDKIFTEYFHLHIPAIDLFLENLKGKSILDLGSGSGNFSLYFKNKGLDAFCIDISEEMIKLCKERGLEAEVMDLENLEFEKESFDGIWGYTSLLHMPKYRFPKIVNYLKEFLKKDGILFIGLGEGGGEGFREGPKETRRYMAYYNKKEVLDLLDEHFDYVKYQRIIGGESKSFINFLCKNIKTI